MADSSKRPKRRTQPQGGAEHEEIAPELLGEVVDHETPDVADPEDVVIDDEAKLEAAEQVAAKSGGSRPVKRNQTVAPVKKTPTKQPAQVDERERGPVAFVKQSIGELKKVVWPTGQQTGQYFLVVLVFVLVMMALVAGLDALFGWIVLKLFG